MHKACAFVSGAVAALFLVGCGSDDPLPAYPSPEPKPFEQSSGGGLGGGEESVTLDEMAASKADAGRTAAPEQTEKAPRGANARSRDAGVASDAGGDASP